MKAPEEQQTPRRGLVASAPVSASASAPAPASVSVSAPAPAPASVSASAPASQDIGRGVRDVSLGGDGV